jgi:hypothetical protein
MDMNQHWNHLCGKKIHRLDISECCPTCGTNVVVESVRYHGYQLVLVKDLDWLDRLFAWKKTRPKKKNKTVDTNQHDYYDRHG